MVWATKNAADHAPNPLPSTAEAGVMEPMSKSNVVSAKIVSEPSFLKKVCEKEYHFQMEGWEKGYTVLVVQKGILNKVLLSWYWDGAFL